MSWMAWTLPTGLFFAAIGSALSFLIVLELKKPTILMKGWLPMATTRGDRFFVSLLGAAFIHLLWLGFTGWSVLYASGLAVLWLVVVMAKG
jgi:predicted small integral membrane protein